MKTITNEEFFINTKDALKLAYEHEKSEIDKLKERQENYRNNNLNPVMNEILSTFGVYE